MSKTQEKIIKELFNHGNCTITRIDDDRKVVFIDRRTIGNNGGILIDSSGKVKKHTAW